MLYVYYWYLAPRLMRSLGKKILNQMREILFCTFFLLLFKLSETENVEFSSTELVPLSQN